MGQYNALLEEKLSNPACRECIKKHLKKYEGFVDEEGIKHDGFSVPCMGIPSNYVSEKLKVLLANEEAIQQVVELRDPVAWAHKYIKRTDGLPWKARWYQELMLRCTAGRRVTRVGRRAGKTDSIAVHILHYAFTNKNKKILVIAPYKAHTEEVIGRIRQFISANPDLQRSVTRDVSSPFYEIAFANGSRIRGFSSGTKSGGQGVSVRGQDADWIYLDEADYLDEGDLKAITAILATHSHVNLWASSTPSGRRANFWRWCLQSPTYKEFHYPSSVLPHWDEIKNQFKADYAGDPDGWKHEVEAEFGEELVSVFQHGHTERAIFDYKYADQQPVPGWTYMIGVDWNTDFGTEISVVGLNQNNQFRLVDALNVPKQGWTQLAGLEAIIDMNAKWRPAFVYADEGAGGTNIELLRKYGFDIARQNQHDPGVNLRYIVKAYNFSSKIEARDPLTKQPIKKHAKPFLVENAVRFFEENRIQISAYDMILRNQLGNYIIKHRTDAGVPVYGQTEERIGDHRLDAFMLALVGFKLEMSDFGTPNFTTAIGISPGFSTSSENRERSSPEKEWMKRAARMPTQRYQEPEEQTLQGRDAAMPGVVSKEHLVQEYRQGFDTDEEEKYKVKNQMRRAKRQMGYRRVKPTRSNF